VRNARVWAGLFGIEHAVIERLEFDEDEELLVAHVRPSRTRRGRCGRCGRRCRGYDQGAGW
jgi:transposase